MGLASVGCENLTCTFQCPLYTVITEVCHVCHVLLSKWPVLQGLFVTSRKSVHWECSVSHIFAYQSTGTERKGILVVQFLCRACPVGKHASSCAKITSYKRTRSAANARRCLHVWGDFRVRSWRRLHAGWRARPSTDSEKSDGGANWSLVILFYREWNFENSRTAKSFEMDISFI